MSLGVFAGGLTAAPVNVLEYIQTTFENNSVDFGDLKETKFGLGACSSTLRSIFGGGWNLAGVDDIEYLLFSNRVNSVDFGNLSVVRYSLAGASNNVRGLFAGGYYSASIDVIDYINIASTGNAVDFGDLSSGKYLLGACASNTRALIAGGNNDLTNFNTIDYVEIATTGNAVDFGDLTESKRAITGCSNATRGLFAGGYTTTYSNVIDYVEIATTGNAVDFGDLTVGRHKLAGMSAPLYGIFGGGDSGSLSNVIDYVTITTAQNATTFGSLTTAKKSLCGCSDSPAGLYTLFLNNNSVSLGMGVFAGGNDGSAVNTIDYVSIASTGNAVDFSDLSVARRTLASCSNSTRGVFGGGYDTGNSNVIDYVTFNTFSNAVDFGDLTAPVFSPIGCSNSIRGLFAGGYAATYSNVIDYVTIASTGNAVDFGDLTAARYILAACSSPTRGIFGGGNTGVGSNVIDYVTIASTGNAVDFGDLTVTRHGLGACSNSTRGLFAGGDDGTWSNVIDYVTIASTGNAVDFGDLSVARQALAGTANETRGLFAGGSIGSDSDIIDYVEIATLGNAVDFGDLTVARYQLAACSDSPELLEFNEPIKFVNTNVVTSGSIVPSATNYIWDWGDGVTSAGSNFSTHLYTDSGSYTVVFSAVSATDTLASLSAYEIINPNPELNIIEDHEQDGVLVVNSAINFNDDSYFDYGDDTIDRLMINYGDGSSTETSAVSSTFIHSYAGEQIYTVSMSAVDIFDSVSELSTSAISVWREEDYLSLNLTLHLPSYIECKDILSNVDNTELTLGVNDVSTVVRYYTSAIVDNTELTLGVNDVSVPQLFLTTSGSVDNAQLILGLNDVTVAQTIINITATVSESELILSAGTPCIVISDSYYDYTEYSPLPNNWINKSQTVYNNERSLFDIMGTEFINFHGVAMTYYITTFDLDYDAIWGIDSDRKFIRCFDIMAKFELPSEEDIYTKFSIEGIDTFKLFLTKRHFAAASRQVGTIPSSVTFESTGGGRVCPPFDEYEPKIGDYIKSKYNKLFYEITYITDTDEMFLQGKHSWTLTVKVFKDEHIKISDTISEETSAAMSDLDIYTNKDTDLFDMTDNINNKKDDILYNPQSNEKPKDSAWGEWD